MPEESKIQLTIETIIEAIETDRSIRFWYNGTERDVDPYVFGWSSEGNPLMRGYQVAGESLSGKGEGWRVYQVKKMEGVDFSGDYFTPDFSEYDPEVTWIWDPKVFIY